MAKNNATLRNLENQVGQLATELRSQPQGALPSETENPRNLGKEHYKALTLRSEKIVEPKTIEAEKEQAGAQDSEEVQPSVEIPASPEPKSTKFDKITFEPVNFDKLTPLFVVEVPQQMKCPIQVKNPPPPYPQRLQKHK